MLDLDFVQLHGEEDKEYMRKIKRPIIKKMNQESGIKNQGNEIKSLIRNSCFLLLDRKVQGHGDMVDMKKARMIAMKFPTFFSGGLTPDNVKEVIKKVKPFAVDVASGIETDGEIDSEKVKRFISNAKGGDLTPTLS